MEGPPLAEVAEAISDSPGPRPATDVDRTRILRYGAIGGLALAFVAAIGMLEAFDDRHVIEGLLSLGYLAMAWLPIAFGYLAAKEPVLEGVAPPQKGLRDVVAGAATGLLNGVGLVLFMLWLDNFDGRDVIPNFSPRLEELLSFGESLGTGILFWLLLAAGLGALGGLLHVLAPKVRRALGAAVQWVFFISLLQIVVVQILGEFGLDGLADNLYGSNDGLNVIPAIVVAVVAAALAVGLKGQGKALRARLVTVDQRTRIRNSVIAGVFVLIVFIVLPNFLGSLLNEILANVGLFLLMGLGLNIVIGFAGLLDLGYVAFFAVGAYTTAVLTSPISPKWSPELSFWVSLPVVIVMAIIAGILVGTPVIRMRGDYLAIVTLGFGEIVRILFLSDWLAPTFGGAQGVRQVPGIEVGSTEIQGTDPKLIFYLVLAFVVLAAFVSWRLQDSRVGRAWMAMREDEQVAEVMGINTVTAKLLAFVTGAILAAFGGALFAAKVGSVFPNSFELLVSIIVLVVVIVGGMGNIPGVAVGALVLIGVLGGPTTPGLLREFQEFKLLIYGALLIYMMLQRPEGLLPSARRSRELHQDEFMQDAWFKTQAATDGEAGPAEASA